MTLSGIWMVLGAVAVCCACAAGQETTPAPHQGKVIFSRSIDPDAETDSPQTGATKVQSKADDSSSVVVEGPRDQVPSVPVTDAERSAILVAGRDLDVHLTPLSARIEARATLTLRNVSDHPLQRIVMQLSSTLRWQSFSIPTTDGASAGKPLFTQSPIATDTDHTGYAQEAVVTLPTPLAPGSSLSLTAFYAGQIQQSAARLELIGTPPGAAAATDWDEISATDEAAPTALRGFGDVLWYPCAAPIALLGDGNRLFDLIGRTKLKESPSSIHLRLTVEYIGEPPAMAIFNGQAQTLEHTADTDDQLVVATHGLATANWPAAPLGFRVPNLFIASLQPLATSSQTLSAVTLHPEAVAPYANAAKLAQPLVESWLGPAPANPLLMLDHPGQTFEDGALLVTPLQAHAAAESLAPMLVHGLTHAWIQSSHPSLYPWIDEGLAQFMNLLWTEQTQGRDHALSELQRQSNLIALAEPDVSLPAKANPGQPLIDASSEIYFRAKAAAVWWQLRDILGDDLLKKSLHAYRRTLALNPAAELDPKLLQATLEKVSERKLDWFFEDWVYRDRSLPDLSIVAIASHPLPAREGRSAGSLVAVEVKNDGDAVAEVPVTIRSGELSATERLRIPAHSAASTRIPFQSTPETVQVNDGGVPELRSTVHVRNVVMPGASD